MDTSTIKEETKQMGLMKKLTSAIVASSLVFTLVGTAAAYQPKDGETAGARMAALKIVTGRDGSGDLQLNSTITRAEFVTVMVRAFGKEDVAKYLTGSTVFPDIANHWASGYIAMAVNIAKENGGDAIGTDKGTFDPNGNLTPAQAVAFLMKFMGVKRDTTKAWPQDYLSAAVANNLITADDATTVAQQGNTNATRGLVFYLLDNAFYTRKDANGETVYTKYAPKAPTLDVAAAKTTTADNQVTISGTAKDAVEVSVGSNKVTLGADGAFTYDYALNMGDNPITVQAKSVAGVTATKNLSVTRTTGTAATIEATLGADSIMVGSSADLAVTVKDKAGNVIKDAVPSVTVNGDIGTYDATTGKFTAGDKPGIGSLTVAAGTDATTTVNVTVTAGALAGLNLTTDPATTNVAVGTPLKLVATGVDAKGNTVDVTGKVSFTATNGIVDAAGNFAATVAGNAKVTATVGTVSKDLNITVYSVASKLAVTNTKDIVANGKSSDTVTVTVQDANGFAVNNYNGKVKLSVVGAGSDLSIMDGSAKATGNALEVTAVNGVATFTVQSARVGTTALTARVQATAGTLTGALKEINIVKPTLAKFDASVDVAQIAANPNAGATLTVKAVDTEGVNVQAGASYTITFTSDNTNAIAFSGGAVAGFGSTTTSVPLTLKASAIPGTANLTAVVKDGNNNTVTTIPVNTVTVTSQYATALAKVQLLGADSITLTGTDTSTTQSFKVALLDQVGNVMSHLTATSTPAAPTVSINLKDSDGASANSLFTVSTPTLANGIYSYTIKPATTTSGNAGTYTITASATDLTSTTGTVTVNPGTGTSVTLAPDNTIIAGDGMSHVVMTAKVLDNAGNTANYNGTITLVRDSGSNLTLPSTLDATAVNGVATWTLTAGYTFGSDAFKLDADLNADGTVEHYLATSTVSVTTVVTGAASQLAIGTTTNTGKKVGEDYEVKVYVKDAQSGTPRVVTSDNSRPVSLVVSDGEATVKEATATTVNGVATFHVTATKVDTVTFHAESAGLTKSGDATAAFASGDAVKVVLVPEVKDVQVGSDVKVTAYYVDQFGNQFGEDTPKVKLVSATGNIGNTVETEGSSTAKDNFTGHFYLNAASFPATGAIAASHDISGTSYTAALPVDSVSMNVYNAGLIYKAQILPIDNVTAAATTGDMTVKVALVDYDGKTLTKYEPAVGATTPTDSIPFDLQVQLPGSTSWVSTGITATDFTNGIATFTYSNDVTGNAGSYSFKVVPLTDFTGSAFGYLSADDKAILPNLVSTTVAGQIVPGTATAVETALIDPDTGADVTTSTMATDVAFVKVKVVDAKGNLVNTFSGQGKLTYTSSDSSLVLVGADSNKTVTLNITNGYAVAQVQKTTVGAAVYTGTFTGSVILSGTTYTADGSALSLHN